MISFFGVLLFLSLIPSFADFQHNGVFNATAVQLTAVVVNSGELARGVIGIGNTSAGAEKAGKAIITFTMGINAASAEFFPKLLILYAVENVAEAKTFVPDKLVAGVKFPGRSSSRRA